LRVFRHLVDIRGGLILLVSCFCLLTTLASWAHAQDYSPTDSPDGGGGYTGNDNGGGYTGSEPGYGGGDDTGGDDQSQGDQTGGQNPLGNNGSGPNLAGHWASVRDSIQKTRDNMATLPPKLSAAYSTTGKYFNQGNAGAQNPTEALPHFEPVPWSEDPTGYITKHLLEKDLQLIMPDDKLLGCINMRLRAVIIIYGIRVYLYQHYYPDVTIETNDFGVGVYASLLRDTFASSLDDVLMPFLSAIKGTPDNADMFPEEIREEPHLGHSLTMATKSGYLQNRSYEAHTYRSIFQQLFDDVYGEICDCLEEKYDDEDQWINFSELLYTPFWRIPELSLLVQAGDMAGQMGAGFGAMGGGGQGGGGQGGGGMQNFGGMLSGGSDLNHSFGSLFPLIGNIRISSDRISPLVAGRRFLGWTTSQIAMQETPELDDAVDYYQRMYPEKSECFTLAQADETNLELFPKMNRLKAFEDESMNEERYLHWREFTCVTTEDECLLLWLMNPKGK